MPAAIDPEQIPGASIDPDTIDAQTPTIGTIATSVRDNSSSVQTKWQGMAAVYVAPESDVLLGLMAPVSSQGTIVGDNLDVVASALSQFAEDVRPIKTELDNLRAEATTFVETVVANGVTRSELNPAWVSANSYGYGYGYSSYSYSSASTSSSSTADIPQYRDVHKEWHEDQASVDQNNDLIAAVNAQMVLLWEAERSAANKIRALYGAASLHAYQSEDDANGYGLDEIPEGTEMPWGAEVERTEGCGEATVNFVFRDFLWEGIVVGGIWGTVEGLGTLVLGYNPATGDWFSGEAYGAAWSSLGLLAAGLVVNSTPVVPLLFGADSAAQALGGEGFLPDWARDAKAATDEALLNTGKGLIAWDKWADDPGTALGESVFNIGTILIPAGAAVAGVKTAGTAASVLARMSRFVDLIDPGAWAVNGALRLGGLGLDGLRGLTGNLDLLSEAARLDLPSIDLPAIDGGGLPGVDVYRASDAASAVDSLVQSGVPLEQIYVRVEEGIPILEAPGIRVELPEGAFDAPTAQAGTGGSTTIEAPVREPELVNAGGRSDTAHGGGGTGTAHGGSDFDGSGHGGAGHSDAGHGDAGHTDREPGDAGHGDAGHGDPAQGGTEHSDAGDGASDVSGADDGSGGTVPPGTATPSGGVPSGGTADLADGTTHQIQASPDQIAATTTRWDQGSFDGQPLDDFLEENGWSRTAFDDALDTHVRYLTPDQADMLAQVRDRITVDGDTWMQKVVDDKTALELLYGEGRNGSDHVYGFTARAGDAIEMTTPREIFERLALNYEGTNFARADADVTVVRYQTPDFAAQPVPRHSPLFGDSGHGKQPEWDASAWEITPARGHDAQPSGSPGRFENPFDGKGWSLGRDGVPELHTGRASRMLPGAEMWTITRAGTQQLIAVLKKVGVDESGAAILEWVGTQ